MPLDTANIISGIKPVQLDNPIDVQNKVLTLSALRNQGQIGQLQLDTANREEGERQTIADLYKNTPLTPEGGVDRKAFLSGMIQRGLGTKAVAQQKLWADADHATQQTEGSRVKNIKDKLDLSSGAISSLLSKPNVNHQDVIGVITNLVQQGIVDQNTGLQMLQSAPTNPADLRTWLISKGMETMDASKRMELALPKTEVKDTGGGYAPVQINQLTGQVTAGPQVMGKTQSPDSIASNSLGRERLNFDKQQGANSFVPVDGVGLFVGNKATGVVRPVTDANGNPVKPQKPLNQDQSNALLFGSRMREADKIINQLGKTGVSAPSLAQQVTGGNGLTGSIATAAANPEQQQVEQAQRDFINATLRRESGASISPGEFENARKQYFVQAGDSAPVIAQKAKNRSLAMNGMLIAVPQDQRESLQPDTTAPNAIAPGVDAAAIAAELDRRAANKTGGK